MKIVIEVTNFSNAMMEGVEPSELAREIIAGANSHTVNRFSITLGSHSVMDANGQKVGTITIED